MSNAAEILSSFEEQLISIINSKEDTVRSMRETGYDMIETCDSNNPEQVRLHILFQQQPTTIITGINLEIDSGELAKEIHGQICELIKEKAYPVEEVDWFRFGCTNMWHFEFYY